MEDVGRGSCSSGMNPDVGGEPREMKLYSVRRRGAME